MSGWFDKEEPTVPPTQRKHPLSPDEHMQDAARVLDGIQRQYSHAADEIQEEFARHADEIQGKPRGPEPLWPE